MQCVKIILVRMVEILCFLIVVHMKKNQYLSKIIFYKLNFFLLRDSAIPQPPPGHKWKEVRHDNSVSWLASWAENIQGQIKYVMLNASSRLKVINA